MTLDTNKELPDIAATRWAEWAAYWHRRVTRYWSLGTVDLTGRL